jgi:hypothetical protein
VRAILAVSVFFLLLPVTSAQEIRFVNKPAPKPEPGKVLVTTYEVSWALRDDDKPVLGSLLTYYSKAQAEAAARRKYDESQKVDAGKNGWTRVKFVQITATTELVDKDDVAVKKVRYWAGIEAGLNSKATQCNELQQHIAAAFAVKGFKGLTADEIGAYLASKEGQQAGWSEVTGNPKTEDTPAVSAIEAANAKAGELYYVVGVITSSARNAAKPKGTDPFAHGHVFAVTPSGGDDWGSTIVASANAGKVKAARLVPASDVTSAWERPKYKFYAIPVK